MSGRRNTTTEKTTAKPEDFCTILKSSQKARDFQRYLKTYQFKQDLPGDLFTGPLENHRERSGNPARLQQRFWKLSRTLKKTVAHGGFHRTKISPRGGAARFHHYILLSPTLSPSTCTWDPLLLFLCCVVCFSVVTFVVNEVQREAHLENFGIR